MFRQLAENIGEVFWLTDWVQQKVLYVSPHYESLWGASCASLYADARSWSEGIHPEDRARVTAAFAEKAELGTYDEEYRLLAPDGRVRWIHDRAFPIKDEDGVVYRMAGISEDITDSKRTEERLQRALQELDARSQEALRSLTSELLLAEERERKRLAEDLHDGLNQTIALARIKLGVLRRNVADDLRESIQELQRIVETADETARSLTFQLSPPVLHDLGFEPALQWLVEDVQKSFGITITLEETGEASPLDERVRILLFRAVRELLINVAKHSHADHARVGVSRDGAQIIIEVSDDGVAFDAEALDHRGAGLFNIRERLSHLGGRMELRTAPGKGTRVTLFAPLDSE